MFVLSYVLPPEEGAAFGKATVLDPFTSKGRAAIAAGSVVLHEHDSSTDDAVAATTHLHEQPTGADWTQPQTGIIFRIDPADTPPNVCSCCGRLVKPGDHALAGDPDAYCLGCFTWKRDIPQCLPENSAHTEEI